MNFRISVQIFIITLITAGIQQHFAGGEELCQETNQKASSCCTCTRQPVRLLCNGTCPAGYFPAPEDSLDLNLCDNPSTGITPTGITPDTSANGSGDSHTTNSSDVIQMGITSVYNVTCIPCDVTCVQCSGPFHCTECAKEHKREEDTKGKCVRKTGEQTEKESEDIGLIIGASVGGGVVVVALVIGTVFCCWWRRRRKRGRRQLLKSIQEMAERPQATKPEGVFQVATEVDATESPRRKGAVPIYENIPKVPRPESIERGHDNVTRYTKDPTTKIPPKAAKLPKVGEVNEGSLADINAPKRGHDSPVTDDNPNNTADLSLQRTHPHEQLLSDVGECTQPEKRPHSKPSDSDNGAVGVGDQNRHDNTNYENTPWLEGRLASPDSPTRQAGRTTDSCIYEPVGNEDVLGNAQHQRDSGYQSFTKFDLGKEREISENAHPYQNYNFGQRKPPVFSQFWQFSEQFTAVGGSLQGKWSDVRLQIPEDALSGAEVETIRGAVCTNLSKVHSDLHLPVNEYIVSPVIEYAADSNKKFHTKKPMRISLPHFMHSSFRRSSVKVYRFNRNYKGDIGFHELRLEDQDAVQQKATPKYLRKMAGVCYFDENNQIQILTDHFSGYLCTYCEKEHPLSEFHLEVYAKIEQIGRQTLGMVSSYIWDRRYTIKDFQQNRFDEDTANNAKMKKIDCVMLSALSKDDDLSRIVLVTELGFTSKKDALVWTHSQREDGSPIYPKRSKYKMTSLAPCKTKFPKRVQWELTATRKIAQDECFRCLINVGYVSASDFKDDGRLCFMDDPEHQTIVVTLEIHPLGDDAQNVREKQTKAIPSTRPKREETRRCMNPSPGGATSTTVTSSPSGAENDEESSNDPSVISVQKADNVHVTFNLPPGHNSPSLGALLGSGRPTGRQPAAATDARRQDESQDHVYANMSNDAPAPIPVSEDGNLGVEEV